MRTLYVSAFLKLTLEKFLQFKLLPKIEYQPIPDMRVSPKRGTCDIIPILDDIITIFELYNSAQ
jgi:hypothetical protein